MGSKISNTELNKENSLVTFFFELDVKGDSEAIKNWIRDDGIPSSYECDEPNTMRFDFFLSKDETKATLIEVFSDSDAANFRTKILVAGPILEPFLN